MRHTLRAAGQGSILAGGLLFGLALADFACAHASGGIPRETRNLIAIEPSRLLPKISTLGTGIEYRHPYTPRMGIRLESFDYQAARQDVDGLLRTELQLTLHARSLLFDWVPLEGKFRATAGIYLNRSELDVTASYDPLHFEGAELSARQLNRRALELAELLRRAGYGDYAAELEQFAATNDRSLALESGTVSLREAAVATGRVHWGRYAPYVGFGWANAGTARRGLYYSFDVGVLFLGRPRVEYSLNGSLVDALRPDYGAEIDAWLAAEERAAEEKLGEFRYFPVISFGIGYSF